MPILAAKNSNVARGGGVGSLAPHWHAEHAKYLVFITFKTALKAKIAHPLSLAIRM